MDTNPQNNPFPLQFGVLEIENDSDAQFGDLKVIQHLPAFVIGDSVNDFGVYNHRAEGDQVGDELSNLVAFESDVKRWLLLEWNPSQPKFYHQRILVRLFVKPVADSIEHFNGTADDLEHLFFQQ